MKKRLYRSRENTMIGGVCGGIAEYLDVDPTLVRIIWAISSVYGGIGVIAYIVCLVLSRKMDQDGQRRRLPGRISPGHRRGREMWSKWAKNTKRRMVRIMVPPKVAIETGFLRERC